MTSSGARSSVIVTNYWETAIAFPTNRNTGATGRADPAFGRNLNPFGA